MATEGMQPLKLSLKAAGDLTTKQYYFVKLDSSGNVVICAAATDRPIGVLQNNPNTNETAEVCVIGHTKVNSDAALTVGLLIGPASDGQADSKVPGTDTTEYICGQVIIASGAAGEIASACVNCATPCRAA